jgi:hypothetical protein
VWHLRPSTIANHVPRVYGDGNHSGSTACTSSRDPHDRGIHLPDGYFHLRVKEFSSHHLRVIFRVKEFSSHHLRVIFRVKEFSSHHLRVIFRVIEFSSHHLRVIFRVKEFSSHHLRVIFPVADVLDRLCQSTPLASPSLSQAPFLPT